MQLQQLIISTWKWSLNQWVRHMTCPLCHKYGNPHCGKVSVQDIQWNIRRGQRGNLHRLPPVAPHTRHGGLEGVYWKSGPNTHRQPITNPPGPTVHKMGQPRLRLKGQRGGGHDCGCGLVWELNLLDPREPLLGHSNRDQRRPRHKPQHPTPRPIQRRICRCQCSRGPPVCLHAPYPFIPMV